MENKYVQKWFSEEQKVFRGIQLFFLYRLFKEESGIVFKGGTALDLFYGSNRFSEDLDFDCDSMDVLAHINGAVGSLKDADEYAVFNDWKNEREMHKRFVRYNLRVSSKRLDNLINFTIDCTIDQPKYPPARHTLNYKDSLVAIKVMQPNEILAEKVATILSREKARDLYDLYHLSVVMKVPINLKDIYEKCAKGQSPKTYSFQLFKARVKRLKGKWAELGPLLKDKNDYKFDEVSSGVLELFKGL